MNGKGRRMLLSRSEIATEQIAARGRPIGSADDRKSERNPTEIRPSRELFFFFSFFFAFFFLT